jgi:hypothetical protein
MNVAQRREWAGTLAVGTLAAVVAVVWPELIGALGVAIGAAALRRGA